MTKPPIHRLSGDIANHPSLQYVNPVAINRRRGARPIRIVEAAIIRVPFASPKNLPCALVEANDLLRSTATRCPHVIEQEDATSAIAGPEYPARIGTRHCVLVQRPEYFE